MTLLVHPIDIDIYYIYISMVHLCGCLILQIVVYDFHEAYQTTTFGVETTLVLPLLLYITLR
jgi:hypothetical protein